MFIQKTDVPFTVAKRDEILAEQPHPHGWTVGLGNFAREQGGNPITPHELTHRFPGTGLGKQIVFFSR